MGMTLVVGGGDDDGGGGGEEPARFQKNCVAAAF